MEKIDRMILVTVGGLIICVVIISWSISKAIKPVAEKIESDGLKSIVGKVWNGSK